MSAWNKSTLVIVSAVILLQGCLDSSVKQQRPADVTSNPPGAAVYANGQKLGKTPLKYNLYDAFPAGWRDSMYQAQGVLMVKMHGCEDYTLKVSDNVLRKPVHAELICSEVSKAEKLPVVVAPHGGTEKRLEELEALYKKGVITKDEYSATRQRILNEL